MDSKNKEQTHIPPQSLSLKFAETLYRRKMNKVSAKPNFIEIQDLLERHEYSIQYALEITAEAEALTASKKQEIKNLLEQLYFYYREINLKKSETPGPAIGIDLGTTNCCVAVYQPPNNDHSGPAGSSPGSASASAGNIRIIHNDMGFDKTPSQVAFPTDQDQPIYGETAKMLAYQNPQNTIYSFKRMIGRKFEHVRQQNQMTFWPFTIIKNADNGEIKVQIYDKNKCPRNAYAPEEISSLLIKYLKESAEDALGMPVLSAVVAVPAYFNAYQRELTRAACQQAGLNVLQLINEPTAAAVAYSVHKRGSAQGENSSNSVKSPRNCLIFDLGGGTFDVAVLTIKNDQLFIKAIGGDAQLGGEDFDNNMVSYCVREFQREHGIDLTEGKSSCDTLEKFKSSKSLRRLKMECEKQKQCLSKVRKTAVSVEAIHDNLDLTVEFTVAKLEELNMELFERCITIVEDVLQKSMLKKEDIHDIILAGGSTRIPKIQQMISEFFPGAKLNKEINPDDAIATGAALLAFYAENPEVPNILIREPEYLQVDIPEDSNNNDVDDTNLDDSSSDLPSEIMESKKPAEFTSQSGQRYSFHSKTDDTLDFSLDTRLSGAEDSPPSTFNTLNQSTTNNSTDRNAENCGKLVPLNHSNQNQTEGKTKQQIIDELSVTVLLRQDTTNVMNEMQIKSEMHGYLERKSYQPGFSTFELIYVALHDKILYFFKTEEDFWANDAGATRVDIRKSSFEIKDYRGSKRSFLLNISDGSTFLFLVKNESLLKDWVKHLERNSAVRIQNPIEDLEDNTIPLENVLDSTDEVDEETGNEIPEKTLQTDQIDQDSDQQNNTQEKKLSGKIQIHGFLQKKNLLIESKVIRLSKFQAFYVSLQGKYLYLFPTKEEFLANADVKDDFKICIHKCSCEIRDYLGSKSSFILKLQNGSSEYLFLAEDSTLVDTWVRKIETNSAVKLVNQFITQRPSNVAEFIRALQKKLDTN